MTVSEFELTCGREKRGFWIGRFDGVQTDMARLLAVIGLLVFGQTVLFSQAATWNENRILVQPRIGLPASEFASTLSRFGGRSAEVLPQLNLHVVQLPSGADEVAVAAALSRNPNVQFAELDMLVAPDDTGANDPYFEDAWHLSKIGAPSAWDDSLGEGVTVAILDTGVDSAHPDLAGQLVGGWNMYDNNPDTSDVYGHGTKVAGVVAAASNNGLGVTSIAWKSVLMPVRISRPDGWAYYSTIAQGLTWAADNGARVANISYAVSGSYSVKSAADYMKSLGGLVAVAAGNSGQNESYAPSSALVSVAATTSSDNRASWSSYGDFVDLSAPGVGIWTTSRGGGFSPPSGTSFSSPVTAAVIALMMAANPSLSPSELETILWNTALDLGSSGYDIYYGNGRVDAAMAVEVALGQQPGDTQPPSVSIVAPTGGTVSGVVGVDVSASDGVGVSYVDLFVDGFFIGSDNSAPYQFSWDSRQQGDGPATLQAFAYDEANNEGRSDPVDVVVDNTPDEPDLTPPTVVILQPPDGATVKKTVVIIVDAQDDRSLAEVKLLIDGVQKYGAESGFSYSWNTHKEDPGYHILEATAEDAAGNFSSTIHQVLVEGRKKKGRP